MKIKEIQFVSKGKAALVEREMRGEPAANAVLTKTRYTVVSAGTERACLLDLPNTYSYGKWPKTEGYCAVGVVEKVGSEVKNFKPGDRVLVYHGTHAEYSLRPENFLIPVKEDVEDVEAAFVIIAAMGLGGLRKIKPELGESAMVMGLGLLGVFALQSARLSGACPLIAADLNPDRRALALSLGADYAFDPSEEDFTKKVKEVTQGNGVNMVVEVSGSAAALRQALDCTARQGRISLLGCTRVSDVPVDWYRQVHCPGITIVGAHNQVRPLKDSYAGYWTNYDDCRALLTLISKKRFNVKSVVSEIRSPLEAEAVFERLAYDKNCPLGVAFDWTRLR